MHSRKSCISSTQFEKPVRRTGPATARRIRAEAAARAEATAHVPRLVRLAMGGSEKVKAAVAHLRRRAGGA